MMKSFFTIAILLPSIVLVSWVSKKNHSDPNLQFVFGEDSLSLESSNLYLLKEGNPDIETHHFRRYCITDGIYAKDQGLYVDDYAEATYLLIVELGVPIANEFKMGEFPQHEWWGAIPPIATNISNVHLEYEDLRSYNTEDEYNDFSPVTISGGIDDGEMMTIEFRGKLEFSFIKEVESSPKNVWMYEEVTGNFYFKGKVNDIRLRH